MYVGVISCDFSFKCMPDSQPVSFIFLSTTGAWVYLILLVDFSLNEDDDNQHLFNCTEKPTIFNATTSVQEKLFFILV